MNAPNFPDRTLEIPDVDLAEPVATRWLGVICAVRGVLYADDGCLADYAKVAWA